MESKGIFLLDRYALADSIIMDREALYLAYSCGALRFEDLKKELSK